MANKSGKLSKLSSALRRSLSKLGHSPTAICPATSSAKTAAVDSLDEQSVPAVGYQTVYVGKCRRAYQISTKVIEHPSFQGLISSSKSEGCDDNTIMLSCEVVLFEHFLWMLDSIDPQTESLDDLLAFYA